MNFESLPTTPRAEELLDMAFSRAARAGRAKQGVDAQSSMLLTASNVLSDNLNNVVTSWPDFDEIEPFYRDLADAIIGDLDETAPGGVDAIRQHLSEVRWAATKTKDLGREYQSRVQSVSPETARDLRQQAFARMADVVEEVADDLTAVGAARDALKTLPEIVPEEPTIVIAGYPNVGKSSFVNAVTSANNEIAAYPFTTKEVRVGHVEHDYIRYQVVDTPGLLDRPMADRNEIERQAVSALVNVADCIIVFLDPSETCGYPLDAQLRLRDELASNYSVPLLTVANKADLSTAASADYYISITDEAAMAGRKSADAGKPVSRINTVLEAAIEAVGYEPDIPFES